MNGRTKAETMRNGWDMATGGRRRALRQACSGWLAGLLMAGTAALLLVPCVAPAQMTVEAGAPANLGSSVLHFRFLTAFTGAPLPDLFRLVALPSVKEQLEFATFSAQVSGVFREASGTPEGTPGKANGINRVNAAIGNPTATVPAQIVLIHGGSAQ
ncbi:MAG: hypothetical protein HYY20_06020 [Candidatus Tectomicrobia bacterium]|uniref:Uncharacterized protein n=1 Tax=Tectimicrobiota bacterium TaxID=2528274 RepID=A0A932FYF8_UNCTE|nr:hypothetical protein [Candidatus Tectomicrobia bacterium]